MKSTDELHFPCAFPHLCRAEAYGKALPLTNAATQRNHYIAADPASIEPQAGSRR